MYADVLGVVLEALGSKHGVFGYIDENGDLVVPSMTRTVWDKCTVKEKNIVFPRENWGKSSWPRAIREKKPNYTNKKSKLTPKGHIPVERHINMPIVHRGAAIRLLPVANKNEDYDEKDIQLLQQIADYISPVLKARLQRNRQEKARKRAEDKLNEYSELLEKKVEERTKELLDTREQLVRKEKLAVLGQLAGGIGHELRNPLGSIKNAAYFLNMSLEKPDPNVKETLELLNKEVKTSERIVSSLLGFARPKPPVRQKIKVNEIIDEVLSQNAMPEKIKVVNRLDTTMPHLMADPGQLYHVFGNIILNAVQAMPEGGELIIKSRLKNPRMIAVSFKDTGKGISKENLEKVFEPLFTTKAKGIGLGLAITRVLVEGHGGAIEVESQKEIGSTFTVNFPLGLKSKI
jgi:signal transduction histidine kinase